VVGVAPFFESLYHRKLWQAALVKFLSMWSKILTNMFQLNRVLEGDADLSMTVPSKSVNPPRSFPVPADAQMGVHCYVK
jgi:hypothetical protein